MAEQAKGLTDSKMQHFYSSKQELARSDKILTIDSDSNQFMLKEAGNGLLKIAASRGHVKVSRKSSKVNQDISAQIIAGHTNSYSTVGTIPMD